MTLLPFTRKLGPPRQQLAGFTLIELLVVVSIMVAVASIIFLGGGNGSGTKLKAAQRIVSGIAQGARGQAVLRNMPARLIVYADTDKNLTDDKILRFCGVVYGDPGDVDADGKPLSWVASNKGTFLPEGIYLNVVKSNAKNASLGLLPTMKLNYPRAKSVKEGHGDDYYYYEFNDNGTMASNPINFNNAWLVLQAGDLLPQAASGRMQVDFSAQENEFLLAGLIFRRVGTTTLVSDPDVLIGH
jgi:prepilin-type N-terminal cleavage/methylation domain-containing protein